MKVLTQNISWEAMTATDTPTVRGSVCLQGADNVCADNVLNTLQGYDILCVQENVFDDLSVPGMTQINATHGRETLSILYNDRYTLLNSFSGELNVHEVGRPWLLCIFDSLVVVCLHAGHNGSGRHSLESIQNQLFHQSEVVRDIQRRPIVVCGDFNMNMPPTLEFFGKSMTKSPNLITCCDSQLGTDQVAAQDPDLKGPRRQANPSQFRQATAIDHIQISPTLTFESVRTVPTVTTNRLASDHLALEALIR